VAIGEVRGIALGEVRGIALGEARGQSEGRAEVIREVLIALSEGKASESDLGESFGIASG